MKRANLISHPEYISEKIQNDLYNHLIGYMEKHNLNQSQLADKLEVTKGYVSQLLNGNFDFRLTTLIKLCIKIGIIPKVEFENLKQHIAKDSLTYRTIFSSTQTVDISIDPGDLISTIHSGEGVLLSGKSKSVREDASQA